MASAAAPQIFKITLVNVATCLDKQQSDGEFETCSSLSHLCYAKRPDDQMRATKRDVKGQQVEREWCAALEGKDNG